MIFELSHRFQGKHIFSLLLDFFLLCRFGDIGDTLIANRYAKPNWGSVMLCMLVATLQVAVLE
jgi:hypothetical protein